jgi:tetratricopeptide (TPR) repeat protein
VYANSGNFRRWEENITIMSSTILPQGFVEQALQLRQELEKLGQRADTPQAQVWALVQQAEIAMLQGRLADAIPMLEKAALLAVTVGSADQVWVHGVLASARFQSGQPLQAQQSAAAAQELIEKTMPNAFYALEGYAGVAEVGITLWDVNSPDKRAAAKKARTSLKGLGQFASFFPIGKSRFSLWNGMYFWRLGNPRKAHKIWKEGLELAHKNEFRYEEGLLRTVLADHLKKGDPARADHLQRAIELFASIGATHAAAQAKSALAA